MKTRKSILLFAVMFLLGMTAVNAQQNQKIAYVDSDYILANIPEYDPTYDKGAFNGIAKGEDSNYISE